MRRFPVTLFSFWLCVGLSACGGDEKMPDGPDRLPPAMEQAGAQGKWSGIAEWEGLADAFQVPPVGEPVTPATVNDAVRGLANVHRRLDRGAALLRADMRHLETLCRLPEQVATAGQILAKAGQDHREAGLALGELVNTQDARITELLGSATGPLAGYGESLRQQMDRTREALERLSIDLQVTADTVDALRRDTDRAAQTCDIFRTLFGQG